METVLNIIKTYKCPKCEHTYEVGFSFHAILFRGQSFGKFCPKCLRELLLKNVPEVEEIPNENPSS